MNSLKVLDKIFSNLSINKLTATSAFRKRLLSTESETTRNYPSEDIPPIPPYKGWQGDDNYQAQRKINSINLKFRYGTPVRMKQIRLRGPPVIRLEPINKCSNRHFYRIALCHSRMGIRDGQIEDLGSYDPLPNKDNEILVALNINRIREHLSRKVKVTGLAAEFLGLAGLLPVHPHSYLKAYRNRRKIEQSTTSKSQSNNEENS